MHKDGSSAAAPLPPVMLALCGVIVHENAVNKIEKKVEGSLKNCLVADNWPQYESLSVHVDSLGKEILKHKHEWLTISDCYSIFYDLVCESIIEKVKNGEKLEGGLWDLLGDSDARKLKETLTEFYLSVPRNYDIYVPIPKVSINIESIDISDKLSIISFEKEEDIPGGYNKGLLSFDNKLEPKKIYLRYSTSGYSNRNLENRTLKKALSNFKIAFQQGISKQLFKITEGTPAGFGILRGLTHYQIPKAKIVSVDRTSDAQRVVSAELPLDISKLLSSVDINTSSKTVKKALEEGKLASLIKSYLRLPTLLMENVENEALRVKSAVEWCFDSYVTEDLTMSFLQTCFGLESLFGEDAASESLTKTLADRCAYLVGTDIKGRKTIRDNFKELYDIRSKLVHGVERSLGADKKNYLNWGRSVLEISLFKEIKHLDMDNTT